jgi:hypothetical protein
MTIVAAARETVARIEHAGTVPTSDPCIGCARASRCGPELLACSAFVAFAEGKRHWHVLPRVDASRERYERVMGR